MTVLTDVYSVIQPLLNEVVIYADQNAKRPALPYSSIKAGTVRSINEDWTSDEVSDAGVLIVYGDREMTVTIQRFGANSVDSLATLKNKLNLQTTRIALTKKDLVLANVGDVVDVAALINTAEIEPRASLDFVIRYKTAVNDTVGVIENVKITESIKFSSGDDVTRDYTIPLA